ncbi:hypothetical protein B484DRAFT_457885 [Ochromonadaceae sp. CCMP2298]|nr:hypothetical protein B484DRAFT_457885 [Ochromonadaceae sp. CCMP2298]|mmetsp:Transcript_13731/g.30280  ORF Transcript_13731/g.30280 Transcript_13731/m.30280 type:complete len:137 (-) Transcript_13731:156-566(-)|eukprot:CAMPEP_0173181956 /NCGR_PEP_ID=MMETSP1141-20130122/7568_1 /TAXON_ID=483371 /ORGANISM="non described non described, Strain CCMP2298" /LENGTH=136 /DNA_ID=CAMNT_0014104993 /DNA_START=51 /DNA_END=461 /DNA_ORIENTATION=+
MIAQQLLLSFLACAVVASGFTMRPAVFQSAKPTLLRMSDVEESEASPLVEMQATDSEEDKKMFEMNRITRLGRSRDQDGKSNIWSIEPRMEVEEEEVEENNTQKNLFIGGAVVSAAIACLPLFSAFSTLFPDPSDF